MKKVLIMALCFLLLIATDAVAQYKYRDTGGASSDTDCSTYTTANKFCRDTDDNKVYIGTGSTVAEVGSGSGSIATDTIWDAAGDTVYGTGANTSGRLAKGTAYQLYMMNSGATAPAWTSTLGATGTRLTAGYFTNIYGTGMTTGVASATAGTLAFLNATNTNAFTITSGVSGAAIGWTLPTAVSGGANYLLNVDADGTMGYTDPAGFQTADADLTTFAAITPSADMQAFLAAADDAAAMTELGTWGVSGSITDEQLVCSETTGGTNLLKSCGAKTTYTEPAGTNEFLVRTGAGTTGGSGILKGTMTDGKVCTYTASGTVLNCNSDAGAGDFLADGSVPMTGDLTITQATPDIVLNDSDDAAGTASINANSSGGANDVILTIGVEDSTGASTPYIEIDGVSETVDFLKPITIAGVSNDNYIKITNNTSRAATASVNELYPEANVWKVNQNGTESSVVIGPTGGQVSFVGPTQARIVTLPDAAITVARTDAGQTFTGVQAFTAPTVATSITPNTAANASLGTGALPFSSVYIGDAATNNVQLINTAAAGAVVLTLPSTTGELALVKNEKLASFSWDGGASAVATSGSKRCVAIPYAATIVGWTMVISGDPGAGGSILNITKDAYSDSALPTTEIDASDPPTVADNKVAATDAAPTGWTTAVAANDIICADVATNAVATWISLTIYGTK
jgi:hypothetical protein